MKKINSSNFIIGFFFTPQLFLAIKVAISFVSTRQKLSNALKSLKSKKSFTGIDQSSKRASGCHSPPHIYNSLLRMRAIHELKNVCSTEKSSWPNLHLRILAILLALFSASVMIFKTKVKIDKYLNESFCDFLVTTYWAK